MKGTNSRPNCLFDAAHLRIVYSQNIDEARGFILDTTNSGVARRYLYEASFRDGGWRIRHSAADPNNSGDFFDRDGHGPFRAVSGMAKGHRKDIVRELIGKLDRFRVQVLKQEAELRQMAARAQRLEVVGYYLDGRDLIYIGRTIIREFVRAVELPAPTVEAAMAAIE